MPRLVDALYMKTGTTDVLIGSSTGGLYQQGVALPNSSQLGPLGSVTWPTTAAQTLVNTTSVQSLTNKTINNITITDPGSTGGATLTLSSGLTFAVTGVSLGVILESTANCHVLLPPTTDANARLLYSTNDGQNITAPSSQINVLGVVTWPSTAAQTLVNTTGSQTLYGKVTSSGCGMAVALASTADAAIPTHGVVYFVATTTPQAYDLPLPQAQGSPLVLWAQTCNTTDTITLTCTAANLIDGINKTIVFNTANQYVELVGLSTTLGWLTLTAGSTLGTGPHVTASLPLFTS